MALPEDEAKQTPESGEETFENEALNQEASEQEAPEQIEACLLYTSPSPRD